MSNNEVAEKPAVDYIKTEIEPIAKKFMEGKHITQVEGRLLAWYPFWDLQLDLEETKKNVQ